MRRERSKWEAYFRKNSRLARAIDAASSAGMACTSSWRPANSNVADPPVARSRCQRPLPPRTERTKTSSSATTTQNDHRGAEVLLGPDRDLPDIAQFPQDVRVELRHCLSPDGRSFLNLRTICPPSATVPRYITDGRALLARLTRRRAKFCRRNCCASGSTSARRSSLSPTAFRKQSSSPTALSSWQTRPGSIKQVIDVARERSDPEFVGLERRIKELVRKEVIKLGVV